MKIDDFPVGRRETLEAVVTAAMVDEFARLSGDDNPLHLDDGAARRFGFPQRVAHGCLTLGLLSRLIGKRLPGEGALWRALTVDWLRPVFPGKTVRLEAEVVQRSTAGSSLLLQVEAFTSSDVCVLRGRATVVVGAESAGGAAPVWDPGNPAPPPEMASSEPSLPATAAAGGRSGRLVLVTGGSGGIGGAIAEELGRLGHLVAVGFHRGGEAAAAVVAAIERLGGRAVAVGLDAGDPASVRAAVATAGARLSDLQALVHAASPPAEGVAVEELAAETFERFWRIYALGGLIAAQALLPAIRDRRWGRLVFLGTSYLLGPPPAKLAGYVAAKSALLGLTRSLAVEVGPLGATANLVSPSVTATRLTRGASPRALLAEAQRNPARRLAEPADTARLVGFLLGDEASFINGAHLPVTGGSAMSP